MHENESGGQVGGEAEAGDKEALNVMAERRWRKMGKLDRLVSSRLSISHIVSFITLTYHR